MKVYEVRRHIRAPRDLVFRTLSDIEQFSQAIPHIVRVEILSDQKVGLGTRFRETRLMNGREATTVLEVTEYVENDRIRLVADAGGTIWDSVFVVHSAGDDQTELTLTMVGNAYTFFAKIMNFMIGPMLKKALAGDMDAVKTHCEAQAAAS